MTEVFLALGSNLGDRMANLEAALVSLPPAVSVTRRSPVYDTDPKYVTDQPRFLNMVVRGTTGLDAAALLAHLKSTETGLGRAGSKRYGPRLIDLDIVFFGDAIIETAGLVVPHPRLAERAFVLRPLADIAPLKIHPVTGKSVTQMLEELTAAGKIFPYETERDQ